MKLPLEMARHLDAHEATLPDMIAVNPDPGDFWCAFTGEADLIEDHAGGHADAVSLSIGSMLAMHGRYISTVELGD